MPRVKIPSASLPSSNDLTSSYIEGGNGLGRSMLFQVTRVGSLMPLWPYVLALHVNPNSLQEQFVKNKNVVVTRGGFVEFVWPDDLDTLSAESTTGAFIGPDSGLTSDSAQEKQGNLPRDFLGRHGTIAWERFTDLLELYRSNGQIFNGNGVPVLRSQIICMYDRGIFNGYFTTFEVSETSDTPYQFKLSWEFKIVQSIYHIPRGLNDRLASAIEEPKQEQINSTNELEFINSEDKNVLAKSSSTESNISTAMKSAGGK